MATALRVENVSKQYRIYEHPGDRLKESLARGRAYAAHFALTHACWLITYPVIGYAAASYGTPATFTVAGVVCLLITAAALVFGRGENNLHSHE